VLAAKGQRFADPGARALHKHGNLAGAPGYE
jgi:hypothetical protein